MSCKKFVIASLFLFLCPFLQAELNFDDDDFLFDLGMGPVRQSCSNADIIIPPLSECKILDILKNDVFLKTSDLNARSLLDMPLFQNMPPKNDALAININFFFNKTDRKFFTTSSDRIDSYLALQDPALLESIDTAFDTIKSSECGDFFIDTIGIPRSIFNTDVAGILALFSNGTVEERRLGFMIDICKNKDLWNLGFKVPIYLRERNFFLSESELGALGRAGLLEEQSPNDAEEFQSDHLISDKVGFGDTRIYASYQFLDKNDATVSLGAHVTIPTALPVQKGVIGSEFRECLRSPSLDLCDILNLGLNPDALKRRVAQDLETFSLDFIDRLSAMLNDCSLGNKGHWGLGLFLEPSFAFNDQFSWRTLLSFEQPLPAAEQRFFIKKFDEEAFDARNFDSTDELVAEQNLFFINQRILDMFFPTPLCIKVQPGPIVFCSNYFNFAPVSSINTMIGVDYWYQGQEHFVISRHSDGFVDYNLAKALNPAAHQLKMMAGASYTRGTEGNRWILSLNGDITVFSTGIGKDYTLVFSVKRMW